MPKKKQRKSGSALESLVAALERALIDNQNAKIESPGFLPDKITGDPRREHDVLVTLKSAHHELTISIECRDRSRKVVVNDIESFVSKCRDTGVNQGIFVSKKGFSKTAISKAIFHGIRCLKISETKSVDWMHTTGLTLGRVKFKSFHSTAFVENDPIAKSSPITMLSLTGQKLTHDNLGEWAMKSLMEEHSSEYRTNGSHEMRIILLTPSATVRNDSTGVVYPVSKLHLTAKYEYIVEFVPFEMFAYTDEQTGELISQIAVATIDTHDSLMQIAITRISPPQI